MAKLRLADLEKSEWQKAQSLHAASGGKTAFGDTLAVFEKRLQENPAAKPHTKESHKFRIRALLKSWSGLKDKDVSRI